MRPERSNERDPHQREETDAVRPEAGRERQQRHARNSDDDDHRGDGKRAKRRLSQVQILTETAQASAGLFYTADQVGYADIVIDGHRETWPVRSTGFRRWLTATFYRRMRVAPSAASLQSALSVLDGLALFEAPERAVHVRIGSEGDRLYLDLADRHWRAVEIDTTGWHVIDVPPVRFRRAAGMLALPEPVRGGSINDLGRFINATEPDLVLIFAWLVAALHPAGPYPLLALTGEQGSAKSTLSAMLRSLVDPAVASLQSLPRDERDLFIAASNAHVLVFDNISSMSDWISDGLCRIATGGGYRTRQLYSDQDQTILEARRPLILNGIEPCVERADLADRALYLTLDPIAEADRRPERELWAAFNSKRPAIIGALLDAVVVGLRELPNVTFSRLPRMADFAKWAIACETAWLPAGTFMAAYRENMAAANREVIEASAVARAIGTFMAMRAEWVGTMAELLHALNHIISEVQRPKGWPTTPRGLSGKLRHLAPALRRVRIHVQAVEHTERGNVWRIAKLGGGEK